ncbi:hypothetical protein [Photobacterium damselae]|uniref:hypothetical protein n=1 Tax=Photobacterium damselae TaxID=38293 RepID=UPI0040683320
MSVLAEKKVANTHFTEVENNFAMLDLDLNYFETNGINVVDVLSHLSMAIHSSNVWCFSPSSFLGATISLPVYSVADSADDAMRDILSYFNDVIGEECKKLGLQPTKSNHEAITEVSANLISESIVAIDELTGLNKTQLWKQQAGISDDLIQSRDIGDYKNLIHYSTILAASIFGRSQGKEILVTSSDKSKLLISSMKINVGELKVQSY